jgi:hypothetical protein
METARFLWPERSQTEKRDKESKQEDSPTRTSSKTRLWPVERFMVVHEARKAGHSFIAG